MNSFTCTFLDVFASVVSFASACGPIVITLSSSLTKSSFSQALSTVRYRQLVQSKPWSRTMLTIVYALFAFPCVSSHFITRESVLQFLNLCLFMFFGAPSSTHPLCNVYLDLPLDAKFVSIGLWERKHQSLQVFYYYFVFVITVAFLLNVRIMVFVRRKAAEQGIHDFRS